MTRLIQSVLSLVASLVLGAVAFTITAIYAPNTLEAVQINAGYLQDAVLLTSQSLGAEANVNVWLRFLVSDQQLVFLGFVILVRVILASIFWLFEAAWSAVVGGGRRA